METIPLPADGLLAAWLKVPVQHEDEFNDWYNTEHLVQVSSPAGFVSARRYRAVGGDHWYLALYDLTNPAVYFGDAFQRILSAPTPWSRRMARLYGPDRIVNVYRTILQVGDDPPEPAPFIFTAQMDVDRDVEDAFHDWYDREHVPRLAAVPGCLRVRRFVTVHGTPRFAAIYDLAAAGVLDSEAWIAAREYGRTAEMRTRMSNVRKCGYERLHVLR